VCACLISRVVVFKNDFLYNYNMGMVNNLIWFIDYNFFIKHYPILDSFYKFLIIHDRIIIVVLYCKSSVDK